MNILLFIIILCVLILVHELGHFLFAKLFGIRVDEFGFGYPPRAKKLFRWRETDVTLNWIPFGGFVRIFGEAERLEGKTLTEEEQKVSISYKAPWKQILVMLGGILFNLIFAWILFTGVFMSGIETSVSSAPRTGASQDVKMLITQVQKGGPAQEAGLQGGDIIREYYVKEDKLFSPEESGVPEFISFVQEIQEGESLFLVIQRGGTLQQVEVAPRLVGEQRMIGISLDRVTKVKLGFLPALGYAAKNTALLTGDITRSFWQLMSGQLSLKNVSGPVGIANQVGQVAKLNLLYIISFTAILSINLAVLNIIPFPALDGGRVFIILIESIIRRKLNPNIIAWVNGIGFIALILLMLLITAKDIFNLF